MLVTPVSLPEGTKVVTRRVSGGNRMEIAGRPPEVRSLLVSAGAARVGTASAAELLVMMAGQEDEISGEQSPQAHTWLMAIVDTDRDSMVGRSEMESAAESWRGGAATVMG